MTALLLHEQLCDSSVWIPVAERIDAVTPDISVGKSFGKNEIWNDHVVSYCNSRFKEQQFDIVVSFGDACDAAAQVAAQGIARTCLIMNPPVQDYMGTDDPRVESALEAVMGSEEGAERLTSLFESFTEDEWGQLAASRRLSPEQARRFGVGIARANPSEAEEFTAVQISMISRRLQQIDILSTDGESDTRRSDQSPVGNCKRIGNRMHIALGELRIYSLAGFEQWVSDNLPAASVHRLRGTEMVGSWWKYPDDYASLIDVLSSDGPGLGFHESG
ncbi:hypothetical protein [Salininema proteolyticum]|uniref:Uncharacterized protein n=1 Tax=Salininema proteolyticum TaxID=1607685 RepID=A0ABV8TYG7_9ACTN